ncbi:UAA transporter [Microthyrium microscopicum]|uniref:UAA transporter n=1 Tax=Microthyrium microscopicum TaxID=703497 RepID=A0A6A6URR4_9PEZI|nr:UAA transporter [Microthyrium microscopicum]
MSELLAPLLIFGGCCSNVYALETILKHDMDSGLLITLMQFILVALAVYPSQSSSSPPTFLKKTKIPMRVLFTSAAMFYAVNMLNNWAFAFNISVPVHIILRSFGSVTTMVAGYLKGKSYSRLQIVAVITLTVGVMLSAWADAIAKGKTAHVEKTENDNSSALGLLILLVAQILSSYMGIYVQDTYAQYGTHWRENLFYSHLWSLPLFLPLQPTLSRQFTRLASSPPPHLPQSLVPYIPLAIQRLILRTPTSLYHLALNSATQLVCITGVNLLGARSSAVTVTIVLNVRKLVSFLLSIWIFGNPMSGLMALGAGLVFGAGALYGWETSVGIKRRKALEGKENGVAKKEELKKEL